MITFRNKGLVDLRAITTFGVNSKDTKSPIGQFGTGFKYAVAVALRLGATISITRGLERHTFSAKRETIRKDEFDLVYMDAAPLGFTTHLGHHWEPWQAFRELYCNMLDEDGEAMPGELPPEAGYTHVYLEHPKFDSLWDDRHSVVLPPHLKPIYKDDRLQIFTGESKYLYYRGVRVAELTKVSKHTFNVLQQMELTEDRTLKNDYTARDIIAARIGRITKRSLLQQLLFTGREYFESDLQFSSWNENTDSFLHVIHKGRANQDITPAALAWYRVKNPEVTLPKRVTNVLREERRDLKSAIELCAVLGYDVTGYPVVITDELPEKTLAEVYPKHSDKIFLSRRAFSLGLPTVAGTILEEFLHLKLGLRDETRQLQNHLLDALMRTAQRLQTEITMNRAVKPQE